MSPENRSTFFNIQEAKEPRKSSAGFGKVSVVLDVVPKSIVDYLMRITASLLETDTALIP